MKLGDVRQAYFNFFEGRGHTVIPSASIVPENDSTTLLTGSGMQALLPFLLGEEHPKGKRLVNAQKCLRAEDIEEVGDNRHTTFFEMLGNWSLGDYFKEEQLHWLFEFLTKDIGLDPQKLYVTVFAGDKENNIPKDSEAGEIWKKLFSEVGIQAYDVHMGSEESGYARGMKEGERIFYYDAKKNWWSRAGVPENMPVGEPGGPDSEIFYDFGTSHDTKFGKNCHPNCDCGRFMEIGNSVFMQYKKNEDGTFSDLKQRNVDFGGGLERITAASNDDADMFRIDTLWKIIEKIEESTGKTYDENKFAFRVIADHIRGAVFMIADGVIPSNTDQGYILRRLLRRSMLQLKKLKEGVAIGTFIRVVSEEYRDQYPDLLKQKISIDKVITDEETQFFMTLIFGLKHFDKLAHTSISGKDAFILFSTYGFPIEMTEELAREKGIALDREGFEKEMEAHRNESRVGAEQKFKGGLADSGEKTTMLHTVTHLMLAGLRKYLGDHVHQAGSNITTERTRFDFTHGEKVTRDILDQVEVYVNEAIEKKCDMVVEQMPKDKAKEAGVEGSFWEKYPDKVNVYSVKCGDVIYSQELCGGPHVSNTAEIKGTFKIKKEESVAAGIRRVKAVLE